MSGSREGLCPLALFRDDEGGFTTIAVATALLVSLSLVFASASSAWVFARSSEVQRVADSASLAGENVVAAYSTVAQSLDACILSMGLAGVVTLGAGMVASCVPGMSAAGARLAAEGSRLLEARGEFARSVCEGLERLEALLPSLVVANSAAAVSANSDAGASYTGLAVPFPLRSQSDLSSLEAEVDGDGMAELAGEMGEASDAAADAAAGAEEALGRGWRADCADEPYCLWERADALAGLPSSRNPRYAEPEGWNFGVPLERARAYYAARLSSEAPEGPSAEELTDSACRAAYYAYALDAVRAGSYSEAPDGTVSCDLPELPRNSEETRGTSLYTDRAWPCTDEASGRVLHSSTECPAALGPASGTASVAELEEGAVHGCETCGMGLSALGRVASASTSIGNGFEHHWAKIVRASEDYERCRNEQAEAEQRTRGLAEEGDELFSRALEALSVPRPKICPPGAWGAVAVVARAEGESVPAGLTSSFLSAVELPGGAAASGAALAPDGTANAGGVLSDFFDGLKREGSLAGVALDASLELWEDILLAYSSGYEGAAGAAQDFLDGIGGVAGGTAGSWLRSRLESALEAAGLEPADLTPRKPVLANTQDVLQQSGADGSPVVRDLVEGLAGAGSVEEFARGLGIPASEGAGFGGFEVAELVLPGTGVSVPLTLDLLGAGEVA